VSAPAPPFREQVLGNPQSPLEHIDHLFRQTAWRIWLGIAGVALLLGAAVVWTAVAQEVVTTQAPVVIVPREGVYTAGDFESGVVTDVLVAEGAVVVQGQLLARVGQGVVRSPVAGRVIAVEVRPGDPSQPGVPMFRIAPLGEPPVAVALYPASQISRLAVGQKAEVAVNGVAPAAYGEAVGRVVAIGSIPASTQRLRQLTGDDSLLAIVQQLGSVREVLIALTPAPTASGLAWSGGNGPPAPLPIGIRGAASVTIGRETLIHRVFR
jgi:hypothetical protein